MYVCSGERVCKEWAGMDMLGWIMRGSWGGLDWIGWEVGFATYICCEAWCTPYILCG